MSPAVDGLSQVLYLIPKCDKIQPMFDFESADREDLAQGPTKASAEGRHNLLDHRWVWLPLMLFIAGAIVRNPSMMAITGFMLAGVFFSSRWNGRLLPKV